MLLRTPGWLRNVGKQENPQTGCEAAVSPLFWTQVSPLVQGDCLCFIALSAEAFATEEEGLFFSCHAYGKDVPV